MTDTVTTGKLTGTTRRSFVRGIAAAGASSAAAVAMERTGLDLFDAGVAEAAQPPTPFSQFNAIAPSSADALEVAAGFDVQVLIGYGDTFTNAAGDELVFGYNNDFLAFFPLNGKPDEGILFVNHEYPGPFIQHGFKRNGPAKTPAQIQLEKDAVGNSFLHLKRAADGSWDIVHGSVYNRRVHGDRPPLQMTGPLAGPTSQPGKVGTTALGSLGNCSGGITPWGTALSCEENYDGYGKTPADNGFGWGPDYDQDLNQTYGWVVEHDPYAPGSTGRKHTALGRFRHENTAFRALANKKFVLYMGDDANNEGVYKFVSDRAYVEGDRANNLKILEAGKLYIAEWQKEDGTLDPQGAGRRRFSGANSTGAVLSPSKGRGRWVEVATEDLVDTRTRLRARYADYVSRFATNRPEDVEVDENGRIYVALTNNSTTNDVHGSVRTMDEAGGDPEALDFTWQEFAVGGPNGRSEPGEIGMSSPDNLVFDKGGNVWVVTDISSSALNKAAHYVYHGNNAVFMVPRSGENAGVAFRFANMPVEAEGTGPYFTPDEQTLFLAVQHPGEETETKADAAFGNYPTYTSYWPNGNKTIEQNPSNPNPSVVAIYRPLTPDVKPPGNTVIPTPPPGKNPDGTPAPTPPRPPAGAPVKVSGLRAFSVRELAAGRLKVRLTATEPVTATVQLRGRVRSRRVGSKRTRTGNLQTLASARVRLQPGKTTSVTLRPSAAIRLLLRRKGSTVVGEGLRVESRNAAGKTSRLSRHIKIG